MYILKTIFSLDNLRVLCYKELWSLVIRLINVIYVILWFTPEFSDTFVQEPGLSSVDKDMLTQASSSFCRLLPHFFVTGGHCPYPNTPIEAIETFDDTSDTFSFSVSARKFCYRPGLVL